MKMSVFAILVLLLGAPVVGRTQDLDTDYANLKDAEAKGDAAAVKKLAVETDGLAKKAIAAPAPASADDKDAWSKHIDYAKEVDAYVEYALYAVALKSQPAQMVDLMATLETVNPKSKYLDQGYPSYLAALVSTGATAKVPGIVEKALTNFPNNVDLLYRAAENARSTKQNAKALAYANRLIAALAKPKPEGVADADWQKSKSAMMNEGYRIVGVVSGEAGQYVPADKNLRVALPGLTGGLRAEALFYLGVANYNVGKMTNNKAKVLEAAKFSDDCAAIQSPYAEQAWKNSAAMKADAAKMR
jgi:hypothetical protein